MLSGSALCREHRSGTVDSMRPLPAEVSLQQLHDAALSILGDTSVPVVCAGVSVERVLLGVHEGYVHVVHGGRRCDRDEILASVDQRAWDVAFRLRTLQFVDEYCTSPGADPAVIGELRRLSAHASALDAADARCHATLALIMLLLAPTL